MLNEKEIDVEKLLAKATKPSADAMELRRPEGRSWKLVLIASARDCGFWVLITS